MSTLSYLKTVAINDVYVHVYVQLATTSMPKFLGRNHAPFFSFIHNIDKVGGAGPGWFDVDRHFPLAWLSWATNSRHRRHE